MAVPSFGGSLNMLAIECALRRRTVLGGCTETFNSRACSNCKLYIGRYINADPRHIDLFMFQAEISASELREHHYGPYKTLLVGIVMIAIILLGIHLYGVTQGAGLFGNGKLLPSNAPQVKTAPRTVSTKTAGLHPKIDAAMQKVARDRDNKVDVNNDGKVNCIDAAVSFYKYYPDKNDVCIMENTRMNHLFNCVRINGVWRGVEPQSVWANEPSYWMRDSWDDYDNKYNKDVTKDYKKYAK